MDTINKTHLCPVCGFNFFSTFGFNPWNQGSPSDEICPSCGFQFGLDDYDSEKGYNNKLIKYQEWQKKWIKNKMPWHSHGIPQPKNWNPTAQLKKL